MNIEEVLCAVENHGVGSTLDLSGSFSGSNTEVWTRRIHKAVSSGNGCGTGTPRGCGGGTLTFPARDDMKLFDGCSDDLFAEQSK